jgi:acyl dehydratase
MSTILRHIGLSDEQIDEIRSYEGMRLRIEQWNHEATLDTIRHWSWGIGDDNPLYCDESYAESSMFGGIIAPPSWLCTVYSGSIGLGLPDVQPYGAGSRWNFYETIRRGDRIAVEATVGPVKVLTGRRAARLVLQTTTNRYLRSDGALVATSEGRTLRVPRKQAEGGLSYEPRPPRTYTVEELEGIRREVLAEPRRGAEPRFWDDVVVGEPIPAVVKGPVDQTTMIAYYCGNPGTPRYKSVEMAWRYNTWAREAPERLPNNFDPSYYADLVSASAGHVRADIAHDVGMPGAYNNGTQSTGWLMHAVTNWMGDHAYLSEFEIKLRRPVVFGDTVRCGGAVTGRLDDDLVSIALTATGDDGELKAEGSAVVRLPRRPS